MKLQLLRNEGEFEGSHAWIVSDLPPEKYPCFFFEDLIKADFDGVETEVVYLYQEDLERMLGEIKAMMPEPKPNGKEMPGVWCCEHRLQCKWQGFALNQGLGWGTIPPLTNEWRKWHDRECGGRLIQLISES